MRQNKTRQYARALVDILDGLPEKQAEEKAKRFKQILYKHGAAKRAGEILMNFSRLWRERKGPIATVVSGIPLSSKIKSKMKKNLKKKKYLMEEKINPSVIGGLALFLGNRYLIDGTIKGRLKKLQKIMGDI